MPDLRLLQHTFGLARIDGASMSPWAPVYRGQRADGLEVVVKRTASTRARALAMARWTAALDRAGVPVVSPVAVPGPNPAPLAGGWWVVYPFVVGRDYDAANGEDVRAAGELLGRIHAAPIDPAVLADLRPYAWPETSRADIDRDLRSLTARFAALLDRDAAAEAGESVCALAQRWWRRSLPALQEAETAGSLPRVGVSSDYKAANLVYGRPTLVDPDNGGLEPRLFDLAMAAVLFHHESPSAPGRLFTGAQWAQFYAGYTEHVTLTAPERELWPVALDHMLWEEGSWVLEDNDDDAWADPRQGTYLRDLAVAGPGRFPLPD